VITIEERRKIYINSPPEKVFTYMSDLENLVDWSNAVISARNISEGAVQVGTRVQSTIRFLGRKSEMTFVVIECKPNCDFTIKSISGIAPCLFYYRFEPVKDGGTVVSMEVMIQIMEGCLAHPEEVVTNTVRRQLEFDLWTLRDMLEASAATSRGDG
jgi:uncharacterized membrane protein